jgi:amino acid adenylation domain-containing protein
MARSNTKEAIIEEYWLKKLAGELPKISLPLTGTDEGEHSEHHSYLQPIPPHVSANLTRAAKHSDKALFILMLSGLQVVLNRYTGIDDLVIGTTAPSHDKTNNDHRIIFCRNTLSHHITLKEFIMQTRMVVMESFNYWEYSLDSLVEALEAKSGTGHPDIFNAAFLYKPFQKESPDLDRFGLVFILSPHDPAPGLRLQVKYPRSPGSQEIVEGFGQNLITLLEHMLENLDRPISRLDIVSREEKHRLLYEFNDTWTRCPNDKTIHELFTGQVERTPDNIALVGVHETHEKIEGTRGPGPFPDPGSITYRELEEKSTRLACYLQSKGVNPGTIAALMVERFVEMMIGILGILKAGAAYLPIDPDSPEKRTGYLLDDSGAKILLKSSDLVPGVFNISPKGASFHLQPPPAAAASLAYVTYTSGSTGKPKGVMIEHPSLLNLIRAITGIIPFTANDTILSLTTISFDIFGSETLLPLTMGSRVVIGTRQEQLDASAAARVLVRDRVTIFQVTPSRLQLLLLEKEIPGALKSLHVLLVTGEALPGTLLERTRHVIKGKIYNLYGPTEATIWSTVKDVTGKKSLNIGTPIANTRAYILTRGGLLQPVGVAGDLYIGGNGLARGYLNNPELTAEKFQAANNPEYYRSYRSYKSYIFYKTGDRARWLPDGNIQFLGRTDFQVKIRGFRIEPGEIENQLLKHEEINEAVILVKEPDAGKAGSPTGPDSPGDNTKYLSAYIVSERAFNISELREYLQKELPPYMIPSTFVKVDRIPLTPNGKVDRKALESYDTGTTLSTGVEYVAPRNQIEKTIAGIWKELLNLEEVGIDENFFDLGGTSLDIYRFNLKFKEAFEEEEVVLKMFRYPTIRAFARYLSEKKAGLDDYDKLESRTVPVNKIRKSRTYQKNKRKESKNVENH